MLLLNIFPKPIINIEIIIWIFILYVDKQTAIICTTIKGKGISFMADVAGWHGKAPSKEERDQAIAELEAEEEKIKNS